MFQRPAGTLYLTPFTIKHAVSLKALGIQLTTPKAAGLVQLAIYKQDPAVPNRPKALMCTVAGLATDTAAPTFVTANLAANSEFLEPGVYFFGAIADGTAAGTVVALGASGSDVQAMRDLGHATTLLNLRPGVNVTGLTYGSLPTDLSGQTFNASSSGGTPFGGFQAV